DVTSVMLQQSRYYDIARDASRQVALGLKTPSEARTDVETVLGAGISVSVSQDRLDIGPCLRRCLEPQGHLARGVAGDVIVPRLLQHDAGHIDDEAEDEDEDRYPKHKLDGRGAVLAFPKLFQTG
ncbi:MAG: hypothetical protein AAF813_01555, partial [Pseudomonadota bacterium]